MSAVPQQKISVLIADDQPLVRRGLALILSPDPAFEVVAEAEDGEQAVALAHRFRPDVVVMDIRMPVLDGVQATEQLAAALPDCRVLALSTFDMDEYVVGALRAGAYGFLPKDISPEELVAAIHIVHAGEATVAPRLLTRLISTYVRAPHRPQKPPISLNELTPREVEVWRLIATGLDNAEIARALDITVSTVKNYITSIFDKLSVRDRAQAVIAAYESGLVETQQN
ncbi:response regulator transcription factor [Streptomyces sp. SID13666]|uniref:response regulator n=1 Tax=Streptomyces TaxID=1883 RepID=UPI0011058355|nr:MULTISPECIES: response regulator transcription factor [Streptomyces]MCZ4096753.1 response regulator transcription factor [Streptomyces sp. H39-C1]NEA56127.1 response regulator transcription factor [Streptomyces sp. SID13666]NEA71798.1 response regulator transcription factor [Streptomyces sp. SID13588]QNA77147.1 response regulator transcription factor [Streptomyces sp. So13.3]